MIARSACLALVANLLCLTGMPTAADAGEREEVLAYVKKNVIGKTLEVRITSKIVNDKIETEFARRTTFTNLVETSSGLAFDEIAVINQVLFDLDEQGKRKSPGRREDRAVVRRHEYSARKSSGHVLGVGRIILNSSSDPTGVAYSERIALRGDSLIIHISGIGYDDFFAPGGRFEPATSDSREEFSVRDGKLRRVTKTTSYDVDPATLKRSEKRRDESELIDTESSPRTD
jgi:hypothetical protein